MMAVFDFLDASPLLRVMGLGLLIALLPLGWVALRNKAATPLRRHQVLTLLTLFLTFDLILFGAFTRLTDSGLGCPDWPGCYGSASPMGASAAIASAQDAMPTGPVTHGKAWIEMIHRYLATSVGVLILVLAVGSWRRWRKAAVADPADAPWWPLLTLFWVCVQGAFGALTVTMKLFPAIVTLHLMGGLGLLAMLGVQAARSSLRNAQRAPVDLKPSLRVFLWLVLLLLAVQVALGGWVSTNYAVLACSDFPTCQNSWWPDMNFTQGFELWRGLGLTGQGEHISFAALTAIHWTHRMMAFVVLLLLGALAWQLNRVRPLRSHSRWLAFLTALQLATGLSNVVLGWPLLAAVLHTGGAAALVLVMVWALAASQAAPPIVPKLSDPRPPA
jgi:cytochrome c oxidase assembly protein subunit 15